MSIVSALIYLNTLKGRICHLLLWEKTGADDASASVQLEYTAKFGADPGDGTCSREYRHWTLHRTDAATGARRSRKAEANPPWYQGRRRGRRLAAPRL